MLLSLKNSNKDVPLLPFNSDDVEVFKNSPLFGAVNSDDDLSEAVSNLMGPGPWSIQKDVPLPKSCAELHFTNKNKKSNIIISHTLKVIFRVQRGDDQEIDPQTGKRKMFDIVVQTPIHILSVRINLRSLSSPFINLFSGRSIVSLPARLHGTPTLLGDIRPRLVELPHRPTDLRLQFGRPASLWHDDTEQQL